LPSTSELRSTLPAKRVIRVALASRNEGKLRELRALFPSWQLEPLDVSAIGEETGATFLENARAKAQFARAFASPDALALGEDSGLEVEALGGRPGIRSARFAGERATDAENVARLLTELEGSEGAGRHARYVCALAAVSPAGEELTALGTLVGSIAGEARGEGGFGYDPVFVPESEQATVAELGDAWKSVNSHRARAAAVLEKAVSSRLW
jgi:XTP/dITP diphosphohydrolase